MLENFAEIKRPSSNLNRTLLSYFAFNNFYLICGLLIFVPKNVKSVYLSLVFFNNKNTE